MKTAEAAAAYLVVQAVAFAAWWAVMLSSPSTRQWFSLPGAPDEGLLAFLVADGCVVIASLAAAVGLQRRRTWARNLCWAIAGAVIYAALYCALGWLLTGAAGLAAVAMTLAALGNIVMLYLVAQ